MLHHVNLGNALFPLILYFDIFFVPIVSPNIELSPYSFKTLNLFHVVSNITKDGPWRVSRNDMAFDMDLNTDWRVLVTTSAHITVD